MPSSSPDGSVPFEREWARCWPCLAPSAALMDTHMEADLKAACRSGRMQFWPAIRSAVITEIAEYPRGRALRSVVAGGALDELRAIEPVLCRFAADRGCDRMEIAGRRGWARAFPDYRELAVWLVKPLPPGAQVARSAIAPRKEHRTTPALK